MNISLEGKVAIVTGASSGIGLAVTRRYLECGAAGVVGVALPQQVPNELNGFGDRFAYVHGDVSEESTAEEFTKVALERFGRIDILVSNAGISVVKALHEHTPEEWDRVMNTNVKATYWAARHIIPVMIRQNRGLVLITGSISGQPPTVSSGVISRF